MLRNTYGFTLMEILVVITIIGILAAIAVPSYINSVDKGRQDACDANVQILITQVERYKLEKGKDINLGGQSLVDFLKREGYLTGQEIKCPFSNDEIQYKYTLNPDGDPIVICNHPRGEVDGE